MFSEMGARRRRLRGAFGDRGQGVFEFLIMGGLLLGSLGLVVREWMPAAAPWGFGVPFVFLIGYVLIDGRRQAALARGDDAEKVSQTYDWGALWWSLGCSLLGVAAFVIALTSAPPAPPPEDVWTPPESAIPVDISP